MKSLRFPSVAPVAIATLSFFFSGMLATAQLAAEKQPALAPDKPAPPQAPAIEVPPPESVQTDISQIELDAIVRVEVDTKQPNFRVPWNIGGMGSGNGTGFQKGGCRATTSPHFACSKQNRGGKFAGRVNRIELIDDTNIGFHFVHSRLALWATRDVTNDIGYQTGGESNQSFGVIH
jgi:hypothetical protein